MRTLALLPLLLVLPGCMVLSNVRVSAPATHGSGADWAGPTGFINKTLPKGLNVERYQVYVPREYTPDTQWPLIVFLHGAGERGGDGILQTTAGLGDAIRQHPDRFPAIVLFPQCPAGKTWFSMADDLDKMMSRIRNEFSIDSRRIYCTGLSMGGFGTWVWGAARSDTFAALMPICGGGKVEDISHLGKDEKLDTRFGSLEERVARMTRVPIWAFHGAADDVVPPARTREMVELVQKAGGKVRYTEYPGVNHNSWDKAYDDKDAIRWLFSQKKP